MDKLHKTAFIFLIISASFFSGAYHQYYYDRCNHLDNICIGDTVIIAEHARQGLNGTIADRMTDGGIVSGFDGNDVIIVKLSDDGYIGLPGYWITKRN